MYCSRYKKRCEEALYHNCDIPSNYNDIEEQIKECKVCVFGEVDDE